MHNFYAFELTFFAVDMIQEVDGVLDDTVTDVTIITKGRKGSNSQLVYRSRFLKTHEYNIFKLPYQNDVFNNHII